MSDSIRTYVLSVVRIAFGLLFICHGFQKTFGMFGGIHGHPAHLPSLFGFAGLLESIGGLFLILGLFTRPVAGILFCEMIYAFFTVHFPRNHVPLLSGGELPLLYASFFLYLIFAGAGRISVDALIGRGA